jgi:hypothetical protein
MVFRNVRDWVEEIRGETEEEDEAEDEGEKLVDHHRLCRFFPFAYERLCTPPYVFGNRSDHSFHFANMLVIHFEDIFSRKESERREWRAANL